MSNPQTTGASAGGAIILGSVNVDTSIYVDAFPEPGETILALGSDTGLGGKGANQAAAASLLGTHIDFIGRVGNDHFADFVRAKLDDLGIDGQSLAVSQSAPTGAAYITVNAEGENTICVVSGANAEIEAADVQSRVGQAFDDAQGQSVVALAQGETAGPLIAAFARDCASRGARFVLNLAPFVPIDEGTLGLADPLIVNEGEVRQLLVSVLGSYGRLDGVESAMAAAELVAKHVSPSVVITLGADGAVAAADGETWHQPAPVPAKVEDTTGAGDAFVGAAVAVLARKGSLREAVRWGVTAGSMAVEHKGTTTSYPTRGQLEQGLDSLSAVAAP